MKRRVRALKKLEIRIRFNGDESRRALVWERFFGAQGKYAQRAILRMSREEYREAAEEFLTCLYYEYFRETGGLGVAVYDPELLSRLGLPCDADLAAVKKRFRELAKKHHPDSGGDPERFIALEENYRRLVGKGE